MATKKPKVPKAWTREQKDAADNEIWQSGGHSIETEVDGVAGYYNAQGQFVPLTGTKAQQILKKKRKPKVTGG